MRDSPNSCVAYSIEVEVVEADIFKEEGVSLARLYAFR